MPVPTFVGAGTGITVTGTSGTVSKTDCTSGNFVIVQALVNGTQTPGITNVSNIENVAGTDSAMTAAPGGPYGVGAGGTLGNQGIWYGRVIDSGTVSVDVNVTSDDMVARIYELSGVTPRDTVGLVIDNSLAASGMRQGIGTSTTPTALNPAVTTNGVDRLALAFVAVVSNLTVGDLTGEVSSPTGVDWTEAVAEYSDTPGTIQLQTAALPVPASITTGGSMTIGSSQGWAVDTTALVGVPNVEVDYSRFPKHKLRPGSQTSG